MPEAGAVGRGRQMNNTAIKQMTQVVKQKELLVTHHKTLSVLMQERTARLQVIDDVLSHQRFSQKAVLKQIRLSA